MWQETTVPENVLNLAELNETRLAVENQQFWGNFLHQDNLSPFFMLYILNFMKKHTFKLKNYNIKYSVIVFETAYPPTRNLYFIFLQI